MLALAIGPKPFSIDFFGSLLNSTLLEANADLVAECLADTLWFPETTFVEALLSPSTPPERLVTILRLFRTRKDNWLIGACKQFRKHPVPEVAALSREILVRCGESIEGKLAIPAILSTRMVPGTERLSKPSGIILLYIPGGEFLMGSENDRENERPVHRVCLSSFWMSKYPVTNAEYGKFLAEKRGCPKPRYWKESRLNAPNQPVVGVSWKEVQMFCLWSGLVLPTEAQWEYACRAGTKNLYWSGNDEESLMKVAWYFNNSGGQTHAVGEKPANPWGLHDMHGNIWEWTADYYGHYQTDFQSDPTGPENGAERVIRGGSFINPAENLPSTYRSSLPPEKHWHLVGFRVILPTNQKV